MCRFFFFVVLVFRIIEAGVERVTRVRRRGKQLIKEAHVAITNVQNEIGRAQVERHTPFRGATSDVGQNGARCNFDFQFMPRAPVLAADEPDSAGKPEDDQTNSSAGKPGHVVKSRKP